MRKLALVLVMIGLAVPCFADNSKIELRGTIDDGDEVVSSSGLITKYFASGAVQQQTISLDSNSYTAFTVPSGAKAILIDVISSDGIVLKGVTGDVGISLDDTTPILIGISADSSNLTLGLQNRENNSNRVKVYWF